MNRKLVPLAAALLLAGCAGSASKPDTAVQAAASPATTAPKLSPEDRNAFFVHFARTGDLVSLKKELDAGIDINVHDNLGQTALLAAVSHSSLEGVTLLLARGADPNATDSAGWNSLHYAAYFGTDTAIMATLLKAGANINARNDRGITPLYFATAAAHDVQISFLVAQGADLSIASNSGFTPLRLAQTKGYDAIVPLLDPNAKPAAAPSTN